MRVLKAHVKGGQLVVQLVVDEPLDLPEGSEVRVALVEDDHLDDAERAELESALGRCWARYPSHRPRSPSAWRRRRASRTPEHHR